MTTPAISYDSGLATPGSLWSETRRYDGTIIIPYHLVSQGNTVTRWSCMVRPASRKSRKDASGWRKPTDYNLTRENSAIHSSVVTEEVRDTVQETITTSYYYDGYQSSWRNSRPTFYDEHLIDRAVSAALLKLKDQKVNFGVAFGEYKETAELVSSVATRIAKGVRAFRSKNPRLWGQVVKNQRGVGRFRNPDGTYTLGKVGRIPQAWLEHQYGWNPLMNDVKGACEALSSKTSGGHPFRVCVKARANSPLNQTSVGYATNHNMSQLRLVRTGKNFCFVRLDYELNSPLLAVFSSLGLTNPLEIAWELLPYSFVIDWFVPVGDWLRTLDADFGWRFISGTTTQGYSYVTEGSGVISKPSGSSEVGSTGYVTSRQDVFSFSRSVNATSPRAGFPTFKNPLSVGHLANSLSLLLNAFR